MSISRPRFLELQASGYHDWKKDASNNYLGLNIEGHRPSLTMPMGCKWYNIVQAIDEPLNGLDFNAVMKSVKDNGYQYIEQAVGINIEVFLSQLTSLINNIAQEHDRAKVLVHVHQYTGTTILDRTLEEQTGIKTILDQTNFFESSIDYTKEYPDITALISISQCAGLGVPAGSWIVPTYFMEFDVRNNVIYTKPIYVENCVRPYIRNFSWLDVPILVVNDLWNPDLEEVPGVLLINEYDEKVLDFVKKSTKEFDWTHDWEHAIKVAYNSMRLWYLAGQDQEENYNEYRRHYVMYLALLHDVCDHKYPQSISKQELEKFIKETLPWPYHGMMGMIEKVSFSKQRDSGIGHELTNLELEIVRDADRLEALGDTGIKRCEEFVRQRGGKIPEDVVKHCFDKLLRLVPEGYISSPFSRPEAVKKHNVIVKYVRDNLVATTLRSPPEYMC